MTDVDNNDFGEEEAAYICVTTLAESAELFDDVLRECGLYKKENPGRWKMIRSMLISQSEHRIVLSIWEAIKDEHVEHFRQFTESALKIDPSSSNEAILANFAVIYPDIQDTVFASLEEFFETFIDNYTKVYKNL